MVRWHSAVAVVAFLSACATATAPPVKGLPTNFGVVEEGKLYRGSQPTAGEIENLYRRGVKTIVKLNQRDLEMERSATSKIGISLIEVPLNARTVGTSRSCADVARAYQAISDPLNWPVYVHCDHGRDRTGFLVGLYRERVQGWTFVSVSEELARYGHDRMMRMVFPAIARSLADGYPSCGGGLQPAVAH
jgi:protein tyrosine/serine phosphatase